MSVKEQINPDILVWARKSAGLNLENAAKSLALSNTRSKSGADKLLRMEKGEERPTRSQLSKIAKTYRRPLLTFYLKNPPQKAPLGEDFRTTGNEISERDNALLDALLRDFKARQDMVRDILEDLDEADKKQFIASASIEEGVPALVTRITADLKIPERRSDWGRTTESFFKELRSATESIGVFVLLAGDLGSHHSALSEDVFRGFALADSVAPFIVVNSHDARAACSFTLLHELVHLYLGSSGVSGAPESIKGNSKKAKIEQFCNEVASLVLLPQSFAVHRPESLTRSDHDTAAKYVEKVATQWMVSEPMVAFRLKSLGWISDSVYKTLSNSYADRWGSIKEGKKLANRDKEGGPNYYVVKQNHLGNSLIDVVRRTIRESRLTHTRAAKVLGVSSSSVEPLLRNFEKSSAAFAHGGGRP